VLDQYPRQFCSVPKAQAFGNPSPRLRRFAPTSILSSNMV
jgi:hypothetical protein